MDYEYWPRLYTITPHWKRRNLVGLEVTFDDGRDEEDLEEVLRAFPDMESALSYALFIR